MVINKEFKSFKEMFFALLVNWKASGKGAVDPKLPLTTDDFKKLYASKYSRHRQPEMPPEQSLC